MPEKKQRARDATAGSPKNLPTGKRGGHSPTLPSPKSQASAQKSRGATVNGYGVLRSVLEAASADIGCSLTDLTVLSAQVDPYRLDTPSGHRDGHWVAEQLNHLVGRTKKIHWRGLHYVLVSTSSLIKPNGERYRNDDENWTWLVNVAGKAARWPGYIPFPDHRQPERAADHSSQGKG